MQEWRKLTCCSLESWGIDKRHANLKNVHLWKNPSWQVTALDSPNGLHPWDETQLLLHIQWIHPWRKHMANKREPFSNQIFQKLFSSSPLSPCSKWRVLPCKPAWLLDWLVRSAEPLGALLQHKHMLHEPLEIISHTLLSCSASKLFQLQFVFRAHEGCFCVLRYFYNTVL